MNKKPPFRVRCSLHGIHEIDIRLFMSGVMCVTCDSEPIVETPIDIVEPISEPIVNKSNRKPYTYKVVYQPHDMGHWLSVIEFECTDYDSFAYTIEFPDLGYEYIGIKKFHSAHEWRTYSSSSSLVKEIIDSGHRCIRTITNVFTTWDDAIRYETNQLILNNVPMNPCFLNIVVDWSEPSKFHNLICENHYHKLRTYRS